MPIKVNILSWRLNLNRLPTQNNLNARNIDIPSLLCPVCGNEEESVKHLLMGSPVATHIWRIVFKRIDLPYMAFSNVYDIFDYIDGLTLSTWKKKTV